MFRLTMIFINLMALLLALMASFILLDENKNDVSKFDEFSRTCFIITMFLMLNICGFAFIGG